MANSSHDERHSLEQSLHVLLAVSSPPDVFRETLEDDIPVLRVAHVVEQERDERAARLLACEVGPRIANCPLDDGLVVVSFVRKRLCNDGSRREIEVGKSERVPLVAQLQAFLGDVRVVGERGEKLPDFADVHTTVRRRQVTEILPGAVGQLSRPPMVLVAGVIDGDGKLNQAVEQPLVAGSGLKVQPAGLPRVVGRAVPSRVVDGHAGPKVVVHIHRWGLDAQECPLPARRAVSLTAWPPFIREDATIGMSSDSSTTSTRDYPRVVLVALAVVATVLAAVLLPALGTSGVVGSPAQSLFPSDSLSNTSESGGGSGTVPAQGGGPGTVPSGGDSSGGGLGALNPSTSTNVGGTIGGGGFRSQNTTTHMVVESTAPAYWRTGAYDAYTGSGWERQQPARSPYDEPISPGAVRGERVEYRVTLNRSATALPTVWRPASVSAAGNIEVTEHRAVRSSTRLGPGTTYTGVSYRSPREPRVLRATGRSYPASIEERYTALPPDTAPRLGDLTDNITADANSPYAEAAAIETWLESNKGYSLDVSRTSDNVAETFVFEMDRGYCEYFATSMTVMLRTQGIPARYVVGYSTGEEVAPDTYEVRGMNAHAWVEVYFEDVGWVKFDPTPGSERLQQEREAIQEQDPDSDYNPREEGSPGEQFTSENRTSESDPTDETVKNETESGYEVSLNRSAVPGATVEVTVTQSGEPVPDVSVSFNGEVVGATDTEGTVTGTVPYAERLRITIEPVEFVNQDGDAAALGAPSGPTGRLYSAAPLAVGASAVRERENVTVPVETNATVTVTGEPLPGGSVTVTAAVQDIPVANAPVRVDGERVARTGEDGRATFSLPEQSGNVTISVERDPIFGATTVTLPTVAVSVDPAGPLALPLTPATVNVTADGEPVVNATVGVGTAGGTTTDVDGKATVGLPFASSATVVASAYGLTVETTVSGLFVNFGIVLGTLVVLVGGPLAVLARRGYGPLALLATVVRIPVTVARYVQLALIALATHGDELLGQALMRVWLSLRALVDVVRGRIAPGVLLARFRAWLGQQWTTLRRRPADNRPAPGTSKTETVDADRLSVREAWGRLLQRVSLPRPTTRTPGEIARHAVTEDGLSRRPVEALRDTFREVEYGNRPASERVERARQAALTIERETDEEEKH